MKPQEIQPKPWRALLLEAAQYIREHGHAKRALVDEHGAACLVGAINMVHSGNQARHQVQHFLKVKCLVAWNNAPERTADEVIAALEGAAFASAKSTP